jgi:hypothetical protein
MIQHIVIVISLTTHMRKTLKRKNLNSEFRE